MEVERLISRSINRADLWHFDFIGISNAFDQEADWKKCLQVFTNLDLFKKILNATVKCTL